MEQEKAILDLALDFARTADVVTVPQLVSRLQYEGVANMQIVGLLGGPDKEIILVVLAAPKLPK